MPAKKKKTREARVREEHLHLICEHPAVKALNKRQVPRRPKRKPRVGVPKLLQRAFDDEAVNTSVTCWRRVMRYHECVHDHNRKRLKREKVALNEELALIRRGANVERDFHEGLSAAIDGIRAKSTLVRAYASSILESVPGHELPNLIHPSSLTRNEVAALKYTGLPPQEYKKHYRYLTRRDHFDVGPHERTLRLLASNRLTPTLKKMKSAIPGLPFPEAPSQLVKDGIITFGGDGGSFDTIGSGGAVVSGGSMLDDGPEGHTYPGPDEDGGIVTAVVAGVALIVYGTCKLGDYFGWWDC